MGLGKAQPGISTRDHKNAAGGNIVQMYCVMNVAFA